MNQKQENCSAPDPGDIVQDLMRLVKGDRVKDIECPKLGAGVVWGHLTNGFPIILWANLVKPCAAGLGTRKL